MIDWRLVVFGAIWILGIGMVLGTLSLAYFIAIEVRVPLHQIFRSGKYLMVVYTGWGLFCLGIAGQAGLFLQSMVWVVLGAGFLLLAWNEGRKNTRKFSKDQDG